MKLQISSLSSFLLFIVLASITVGLRAQSASYSQFTNENDLPSNEVYAVFQDSKGYLWLATDRGVSKYDGNQFRNYTSKDGLPDNTIFNFYEDQKHRIWFLTYNGELGYYKNGHFQKLKKEPEGVKMGHGLIHSIYVNADTLQILARGEDIMTNNVYQIGDSTSQFMYQQRSESAAGYYPLETDEVLIRGVKDTASLRLAGWFRIFPHTEYAGSFNMNKWIGKNYLYLARGNWLGLYEMKSDSMLYEHHFKNTIRRIIDYKSRIYVLVRNEGIYELDSVTHNPRKILNIGVDISNLLVDETGVLWVSTLTSGVLRYNNLEIKEDPSLSGKNVSSIFNNKYLWIKADTMLYFRYGNKFREKKGVIGRDLRMVYQLDSSRLVTTFTKSYIIKDTILSKCNLGYYPTSIAKFEEDSLLLVHDSRILKLKQGQSVSAQYSDWRILTIEIGSVRHCIEMNRNNVLLGGLKGVFQFNVQSNEIKVLGEKYPMLKNRIVSMNWYDENTYVFGTRGVGLIIGNLRKGFKSIGQKEGLLSDLIGTVKIDKDHSTIWVSTNKGLSRVMINSIDPLSYSIENITKEDGLASRHVNDVQVVNDTVYVATSKGLNYFPVSFKKQQFYPKIDIQSIDVNSEPVKLDSLYELNYDQNTIELSFFSPTYRGEKSMSYKFRMIQEEGGTEWSETKNSSMQFISLSPGRYIFQIKAISHDGLESKRMKQVIFNIKPPLWFTWWALVLYTVVILSVFYLILRTRIERNREKEATRRKIVEMELKALRSQMNPHFTFNTMNSIQHFINSNEPEEANIYISKFSRLIRMILDNSREEFITIEQELDALRLYLEIEKLRFFGKFNFEIQLDKKIDQAFERIPPLVIQPFAENAIWHGLMTKEGARNLTIKLKMQDKDGIICVVEDNGIGRKKAGENKSQFRTRHKSHGMNITQTRLELLNSMSKNKLESKIIDLTDENGNAMGTRVEIYIPIK